MQLDRRLSAMWELIERRASLSQALGFARLQAKESWGHYVGEGFRADMQVESKGDGDGQILVAKQSPLSEHMWGFSVVKAHERGW